MQRRNFIASAAAVIGGAKLPNVARAQELRSLNMGVLLRPTNVNFYGAFLTPPDGDMTAMWEGSRYLETQAAQVDAVRSVRGNLVCSFLDCRWAANGHGVLTLDKYLARIESLADYIASKNMFWLPYCSYSMHRWNDANARLTNKIAIPILVAEAQILSRYPNVIGLVLNDEPFVSDADIAFASDLGDQYKAVKAVVPNNFAVTVASNPCGNQASIAGNAMAYGGTSKVLFDSIAAYQDFLCFNPQDANVASDLAALIGAYPAKQIAFGGGNAATDDGVAAKRTAALLGMIGSNNVRLYSQFAVLDFGGAAYGMFNSDYSPRRPRTDAFTITLGLADLRGRTSNR